MYTFWLWVIGAFGTYFGYRIYSGAKKRSRRIAREKWLLHLQRAHDTKNWHEVIKLMGTNEPNEEKLCIVLGNALLMTGDVDRGRKILNKAFTYGYKNNVHRLFGFAELNAGNYKEAIAHLQSIEKDHIANELKYDDGYDIIENLGVAFMKLGKYDLAIEALKGAPLGKRNITDGLNRIFILLAECYEKIGDKKNAIKFYTKSVAYKYNVGLQKSIDELQSSD